MTEIQRRFAHLGKWQARGLALFSYGGVQAEHCWLSKIAERLPEWGSPVAAARLSMEQLLRLTM